MAKKYYSDITKKIYDDEETLEKDEKALEDKKALALKEKEQLSLARKEDAKAIEAATKKVNDAYKTLNEAQDDLYAKKKAFLDKYGSYHYTTTDPTDPAFVNAMNIIKSMNDYFDSFFKPCKMF